MKEPLSKIGACREANDELLKRNDETIPDVRPSPFWLPSSCGNSFLVMDRQTT
jgi:hypothetical protein